MSYKGSVSKRDEHVAAEVNVDRTLMCPAAGCPNRWSVAGERGRGCSAHYWADPHDWPRITQRLLEAETDRARYGLASRPAPSAVTPQVRKAAVMALGAFVEQRGRDSRAWARELQQRHRSGEQLTAFQVDIYRVVVDKSAEMLVDKTADLP